MTPEMSSAPAISVVMPVYNGERFLAKAIESTLNQTFHDFEFIIIDDASTDSTHDILTHYQLADDRIRVYRHTKNKGVTAALNWGCSLAKGSYIARMDADDISLPERFDRQINYMRRHAEIGVLGTRIQYIDESENLGKVLYLPHQPGLTAWSLMFFSSLAHPSVMMRRDILERLNFYDPQWLQSQDYDLWFRAANITRLTNLPDVLLLYRHSENSISSRFGQKQAQNTIKILQDFLMTLTGQFASPETINALHGLAAENYPNTLTEIRTVAAWIERLWQRYPKHFALNEQEKRIISSDASVKLWLLAVLAFKYSPRYAISRGIIATIISPLSAARLIVKVIKKAVSRIDLDHIIFTNKVTL